MITLAAGRFTPAAKVLVEASTRSAPLLKAFSMSFFSSMDKSAGLS